MKFVVIFYCIYCYFAMSTPTKEVIACKICGSSHGQIQKVKFCKCNDRLLGIVLVTVIGLPDDISNGSICRNCVDKVKTIDSKILSLRNLFAENQSNRIKRCNNTPTKRSSSQKMQQKNASWQPAGVTKMPVCRTHLPFSAFEGSFIYSII